MPVKKPVEEKLDVGNISEQKLIELALQNKSKKCSFTFKDMLRKLNDDEMDKIWQHVYDLITKKFEDFTKKASEIESPKKLHQELNQFTLAAIDITHAMMDENIPIPKEFLQCVVYLDGILPSIPSELDNLKNAIAHLCEKMHSMSYIHNSELFVSNTLMYLLRRSTNPKAAKRDIKRIYPIRTFIPKIIPLQRSAQVWDLLTKCAESHLYSSTSEAIKILAVILTIDIHHIGDIHEIFKKKLSSCSLSQAAFFGKVYFEAWSTVKTYSEQMKNAMEITCVTDLILQAITSRRKSVILNTQKVLAFFHCKKKETDVLKMLYSLYYPILWRYLRSPDGLVRANASELFLAVFPLENPDLDVVSSDLELNDQLLMIKELLIDEYTIVRSKTTVGLLLAMSCNWELFPEEMLKTYFKILICDLSCDSSSSDVRCAVAKGFKGLLENPLTIPTLIHILPKLGNLFNDISSLVRVAFCQLLLSVKKLWGIRYFDIVPLKHLLARMEEDAAVSKIIVNLIHNSFIPKNEHPSFWLARCADMIKTNRDASREFFRHVPRYIGVEAGAKFMVQTIKTIHFYVKSKVSSAANTPVGRKSQRKSANAKKITKEQSPALRNNNKSLNQSADVEAFESAIGFQDPNVVGGFIDAVSILWLSCNLAKPENKNQLKMVVGNLSKWMEDIMLYYKDTPVWSSAFYLSSLMPPENVPSLVALCQEKLEAATSNEQEEDNFSLLQSLCNQREGGTLLSTLKQLIRAEFTNKSRSQKPTPKRRKTVKPPITTTSAASIVGLKLLDQLLDVRSTQKIILVLHAEELKSFLELITPLKARIESLSAAEISEEEADFVPTLLLSLLKISVLLHSEDFNGIKFVEDVVVWVQEKLLKIVWPQKKETPKKVKRFSLSFEKLLTKICRELCVVLADMIYLGYLSEKKYRFIKFGIELLNLGLADSVFLPVCKMFFKHVWASMVWTDISDLQIAPDCLNKINQTSANDEIMAKIPNSVLKEIQMIMDESIKMIRKCDRSYSNLTFHLPLLDSSPPDVPSDTSGVPSDTADVPLDIPAAL